MKTSLSKIIFRKTIWLVLLLVLSIVGFVYFYTIGLVEKEFLTYVENYQKVKSEKENLVFNNAIKDVNLIATQIKQELSTKHSHHDLSTFFSKFNKLKDGSIRSRKETSEVYPVLFLNKDSVLTKKLEQKILISNQVLENVSKDLSDFYYNTWVVFPENGNFCISKYKPKINYEIPSSFSDLGEDYWTLTTNEKNKDRNPIWTDLYYDPSFKQWMISYVVPVDINGVHELSIGVDISLNYLFEEIISGYSLSKNFILSKNGQLIMHPDYLDEIKIGKKYVWDLKNDEINDTYSLIQESEKGQVLKMKSGVTSVSPIKGNDWYLVSYYSNELIFKNILKSMPVLFIISGLVVLLFYLFLSYLFKKEILFPLEIYSRYFEKIKRGNYNFKISTNRKDEFGELSLAFNAMVEKIKETNNKLNSKNEELEKELKDSIYKTVSSSKLATLGEMSAGVAHEINNPLTGILGNLEFLKRDVSQEKIDIEKVKTRIEKSTKLVERISKIVLGLKMFSRNSENDEMVGTEVGRILEEVSDLTKVKLSANSVNLIFENEYPLLKIKCRESQILQVLVNLVNNSFDAVLENKNLLEKWVKVSTEINENVFKIKVTDSGSGIPDVVIDKMFNPFFTTKPVGKGTGLGLSISKGIIDQHSGRFYYNKESKNTEFVIELPIEKEG